MSAGARYNVCNWMQFTLRPKALHVREIDRCNWNTTSFDAMQTNQWNNIIWKKYAFSLVWNTWCAGCCGVALILSIIWVFQFHFALDLKNMDYGLMADCCHTVTYTHRCDNTAPTSMCVSAFSVCLWPNNALIYFIAKMSRRTVAYYSAICHCLLSYAIFSLQKYISNKNPQWILERQEWSESVKSIGSRILIVCACVPTECLSNNGVV